MTKRVLLYILIAVLFIGCGMLMFRTMQEDQAAQAALDRISDAARPLEVERHQLRQELTELEKAQEAESTEAATVQLLMCSMDVLLYDVLFPQMKQYGVPGMMLLSEEELPGLPGKISLAQYSDLMANGWSICVGYGSEPDWYNTFSETLQGYGIPMPDTVYFEPGQYSSGIDGMLTSFRNVIHHGEGGLPLRVTGLEPGLWHLGAAPWNNGQMNNGLREICTSGGNRVFTVSDYDEASVRSSSFGAMLNALDNYSKNYGMVVCSPAQARRLRLQQNSDVHDRHNANAERIAQVEERLAEIDAELTALFKQDD